MALNPLPYIKKYESGGKNVPNYMFGPGYTAQGSFQITNSTWRDIAPKAGIDLKQYPNAMSAPYSVQEGAATALFNTRGFQPWAPHNPALRAAIASAGGPGAFVAPGQLQAGTGGALDSQNIPWNFSGIDTKEGVYSPELPGTAFPADHFQKSGTWSDGTPWSAAGDAPGSLGGGTMGPNGVEGADPNALTMRVRPSGYSGADMAIGPPSKTVPLAIDRQRASDRATELETTKSLTDTAKENTKTATDKAQTIYDSARGSLSDYFTRAVFVIVGLIALGAAFKLFGGAPQRVILDAAGSLGKGARKLAAA